MRPQLLGLQRHVARAILARRIVQNARRRSSTYFVLSKARFSDPRFRQNRRPEHNSRQKGMSRVYRGLLERAHRCRISPLYKDEISLSCRSITISDRHTVDEPLTELDG
jgi:hypothetical protein